MLVGRVLHRLPPSKMRTSQNVSSETHVTNFFFFVEKLCPVLKIFKFLYF